MRYGSCAGRARGWYDLDPDWNEPQRPSVTILEDEKPEFEDTGLIDKRGNALYRRRQRRRIGF